MNQLSPAEFAALQRLDTCTVANAIESFEVRLRNEGFADRSVHCLIPELPAVLGYAVTVRIRCSSPPSEGHAYKDRTDWWSYITKIPAPRIVVIEDVDRQPGTGAFLGEVHANILRALDCVGAVTNGTVRDISQIRSLGFQVFASGLAVSHAYAHIVDFGCAVSIGGLDITPGDLLHADRHGVLHVPEEIAARIPEIARENLEREKRVIELCHSRDFSLDKLRSAVRGIF